MKPIGWIYIVVQPAIKGLVKIGWTRKDPNIRAKSFDGTHAPFDHVLVYRALVDDANLVEQEVHSYLVQYREAKEWFRMEVVDARAAIVRIAAERLRLDEIHPDYSSVEGEKAPPPETKPIAAAENVAHRSDNSGLALEAAFPYPDGSYKCPHCGSWRNSREFGSEIHCLCGGPLLLHHPL